MFFDILRFLPEDAPETASSESAGVAAVPCGARRMAPPLQIGHPEPALGQTPRVLPHLRRPRARDPRCRVRCLLGCSCPQSQLSS
eukprot:9460004-Pyramimonas_sp.AAC.1